MSRLTELWFHRIPVLKGSEWSGNWGHTGTPGRGGSPKTGGIAHSTEADLAWVDSLSVDEREALAGYMNAGGPLNAGAAHLNSLLRSGKELPEEERGYVELIDAAVARAPKATRPTLLYRGMPADRPVFDGAFVSAGRTAGTAWTYTETGFRVVKKFVVPVGTPIAPVSAMFLRGISEEVLLPRFVDVLYEKVVPE